MNPTGVTSARFVQQIPATLFFTSWLMVLANKSSVKAAKVALCSERLWLKVAVQPIGEMHRGITGEPDEFTAMVRVEFENVGKSLANVSKVFLSLRQQISSQRPC